MASVFRAIIPEFLKNGWAVEMDFNDASRKVYGCDANLRKSLQDIDLFMCGYDDARRDQTSRTILQMRERKIPSVGFLDAWRGTSRFWYENGDPRPIADITYVPDQILKNHLISRGMSHEVLQTVIHPVLTSLLALTSDQIEKLKQNTRSKLGFCHQDRILVFFSEPLHQAVLPNGARESLCRMNIRGSQRSALDHLAEIFGSEYKLVLRAHPLESGIHVAKRWVLGNDLSLEELLICADLVCGVGATPLIFTTLLGKPVINLCEDITWRPGDSNYDDIVWSDLINRGRVGQLLKNYSQGIFAPSPISVSGIGLFEAILGYYKIHR